MSEEVIPESVPAPMREDIYLDHRRRLDELRVSQIVSLDKALLALSSGALGLSVVLLTDMIPEATPTSPEWLVACWISFALAIGINLFSYQLSAWAAEQDMYNLDRRVIEGDWSGRDTNRFNDVTKYANLLAAICFGIGAACLLVFAYHNALKEPEMAKIENTSNRPALSNTMMPTTGTQQNGVTLTRPPVSPPAAAPSSTPSSPTSSK